jgi:hypothetical protein
MYSGQALGKALFQELKGTHQVTHGRPDELVRLLKKGIEFDYVVNIGWFKQLPDDLKILNRPGVIAHSSNKLRARQFFVAENIPAPELWTRAADIPKNAFPVVARTTHHSKGKGFWYCTSGMEATAAGKPHAQQRKHLITTRKGNKVWRTRQIQTDGASHFLKFIPNTREFRIHVMAPCADLSGVKPDEYVVVKLSEKTAANKNADQIVKNHDNGWVFGHPADSNNAKLQEARDIARQTVAKLGLHWGAVDIMLSKDDNKIYVLEVNSTPCLTDDQANTLEKYAAGIKSLLTINPPLLRKRSKDEIQKEKKQRQSRLQEFLSKHKF